MQWCVLGVFGTAMPMGRVLYYLKMKKTHFQLRQPQQSPDIRSSSSGNLLAKRLYRNNSLNKLTPLNSSMSALGSLNTSLIPSVSLRKLVRLQHSPPSLEISQGKIHLRRHEQLPSLSQTGPLLRKRTAPRKFQKIDSITEKSILPQELKGSPSPKAETSILDQKERKPYKPSRKWLAKLKQGQTEEKLTPADFIQLMEEEGGLGNEFCYLQKGEHPYDLRIVEFGGVTGDEYITISARGVTYFNWEGSRFVSLQEWRREAMLFERLMKLQFFGKYRLHKNFSNWKKYTRKIGMKKTTDRLKAQLLVHDRHLRTALLATRHLCCRMEKESYCCFDDAAPALPFSRFKAAQETYLQEQFQCHLTEIEEEIKCEVASSLGVSMRDFKEENKISSGKEAKGLPLLIGDEKNLQMPYTKEATLRVQQQKFKRFLKLVELLVVHSKVAMMTQATAATARKLTDQNESYREYLQGRGRGGKESHFKGKQYIQCQLVVEESEERSQLRPSREELTNLMEDIVNKSIIKLVRNHHHIISDPDINAILYEGAQDVPKDTDSSNTLKAILGAQQKQEEMVALLTKSVSTSYGYLQDFSTSLAPLVAQYFRNQSQLARIPNLSSSDFFMIREWIERWRKELQEMSRLSEEHESAVFVLNFKAVKEMAIHSCNLCLSRMKEIVPRILQTALRRVDADLKDSLRLMEATPIGIQLFIDYQHNKVNIAGRIDQFDDTLGEIGQLIEIMKELGSSGETAVLRGSKERKELGETLKALRGKLEQAEMHSKVHQTYAIEQVRKMVPRVSHALQSLYAKTKQPRGQAEEMCLRVQEWAQQLGRIQGQLQRLKDYQRFLGMQDISEDSLHRFTAYFRLYSSIWAYRRRLDQYHDQLLMSEWRSADLQSVKATLEGFLEESQGLKKEMARSSHDEEYQIEYLEENEVSAVVGEVKKKIRPLLEAMECLRDPSLEEREQRFIRSELEKRQRGQLARLVGQREGRVRDLLREGVVEQLDFLKKVVFKSKKQVELNSKMTAVSRFWGESASHSSKSLIDNFSQHYWLIAEEIDEKITVINCVREDPQIEEGQFKNRVETEKNMFDSLRVLLGEWEQHHNFLAYFQPIFANAYWKGTAESKAYAYAESNWKKLTKQISKDFSLRKLASQEKKHLAVLRENNAIFQQLKFAVEMFLNAKREAFPKLYFLADEELLHLLLQDKDYASIDKHLSRIFPNLKSLQLNQDRNCPTAVRNLLNESLPLRPSPAKQVLELEQGLRVVQQRMREGIRSGLLKCSNYYLQDDFSRAQWIRQNILQVLLFIGNAEFTKLLQYDYLQPEGDDPKQLLAYQISQIKELNAMIREEVHLASRQESSYKLSALLMQAGHFRDIISRLIQCNVNDDASYEWLREVRSYYNGNDLAVTKYLTRAVQYGYEFVCANYSFTIATLSEKQMVEVVNTAALGYIPVLEGNNQVVQALCNSNARSYYAVALKPSLSPAFLQNVCQGALSSSTYLELSGLAHLTPAAVATISGFIFQAKSILERREAFHLGLGGGKSGVALPSFNLCLRVTHEKDMRPFQEHLKASFRIVKVPQVSISAYMQCITELAFLSAETELGLAIQKTCQVINSCCGHQLFGLQEVRGFVLGSFSDSAAQFKQKMVKCFLQEINAKFVLQEQIRFYEGVVAELLLGRQPEEPGRGKVRQEWDPKVLLGHLTDSMKKRQACILVGPSHAGKTHLIFQASRTCGTDAQVFPMDLLPRGQLLGSFQNGLWKEGVLSRHLKQLTYSQEEWLVFDGAFGTVAQQLVHAAVQGKLLQLNGETLYLSPNWKFLFSTSVLPHQAAVPVGCEVLSADRFAAFDQELQQLLQTRAAAYFRSNVEGLATLKNLCVNNFEKILKFRLKGRFLRPQHILTCFIGVLQSLLAKCPQKQLQQRENQAGVQRLFLWSIFWTVNTGLSSQQSKKFQSQLFEQIKIDCDRSQPLGLTRFEFDSPQGSLKRVQQPVVHLNGTPYLVSGQMEANCKFVEMLVARSRHVLLIGEDACGKSQFLNYLQENLGKETHSFLRMRLGKDMGYSSFEDLLYRKAKIVVNSKRQKHLCAINGKKLVLLIDDLNLLDERSPIGIFLKSILTLGYYHDPLSLEKIHLSNVVVLAAQNSSYQFALSYQFTKCFQPLFLPAAPLREIVQLYRPSLPPEYAAQLCHNIAALHEFALMAQENTDVYFKRSLSLPCRVLKGLQSYQGKENVVKVWEYMSVKLYVLSNPPNESFKTKITAQIKNYSNLMLKNNQEDPSPIDNQDSFLKDILQRFPILSIDDRYADYYVYVAVILQMNKPFSLYTLNEPICPSKKEEILLNLCNQNEVDFLHPFRAHQIASRPHSDAKILVYFTDSDAHFDQLVDSMLSDGSDGFIYLVDFTSEESWKNTMDKHPSIIHFGTRYYKEQQKVTKLGLSPQLSNLVAFWLNQIQQDSKVSPYCQQEICKAVKKNSEKLYSRVDMIIAKKERLFQASKEIKEKAKSSRKEMEELREQLQELVGGEQKKRRELLQLKNNYQGELTQQVKMERNQKIQSIEIELNEIMSQRRANEDRTRTVTEEITKLDKITLSTATFANRIERELVSIKTIKEHVNQIEVFLAIVEYFFNTGDQKYDNPIQSASATLPLPFEEIMEALFNCRMKITQKTGVLWLFSDKSIIIQDEREELAGFLQKKYKNVHIIRQMKDLEDISQLEEDKAYIFIGQLRSEAAYLTDVAITPADKERLKKDQTKQRQQRYVKEQKEQKPDYGKNIYFIYKQREREQKTPKENLAELSSAVSVRSKQLKQQAALPIRRVERKATRMNTLRNTLNLSSNSTHAILKKEESKMLSREKDKAESIGLLKQEATIKIKYKETKESQGYSKADQEYQDYLVISLQNEVYYHGGKKITLVQSKFHNHIPNVTFICRKPTPKTSREYIHKYEPVPSQDIDHLFEEMLEEVDPLQTNIISNLQQQHEKILNKSDIQEKIIMDRLMESSPKSLTDIAKNSDFLLSIQENVKSVKDKLVQARRLRAEPYSQYFKYCLIWKDYEPLLKEVAPYFRMGKDRVKKMLLDSIKYNERVERDGQIIEPQSKIDEGQSIQSFKKAVIKEVIISQAYLESLYSICLFALLLQVKEEQTDKAYVHEFLQIIKHRAEKGHLETTLNQKHCSKQLQKVIESYARGSSDFIYHCHTYVMKRLDLNFEKDYYQIKSEWQQINEPLIAIATPGADPFAEQLAERTSQFIKENADHSKCLEAIIEKNFHKLVLVNFVKEESYTKILYLVQELQKETEINVVLLFTSLYSYQKCSFLSKVAEQRIVMIEQNRTLQRQMTAIMEKGSKVAKGEHDKIVKYVLFNEINTYFKERIKSWSQEAITENACFYNTDLLLSLLAEAKIGKTQQMSLMLSETVFSGRQDLLRQSKRWAKREEEEALGKTFHSADVSEEHALELNHFINSDLSELKTQITSVMTCQDFAKTVLPYEDRKQLTLDMLYALLPPLKRNIMHLPGKTTLEEQWEYVERITFESFKTIETNNYKKETDIFKHVVRQLNLGLYLQYKEIQHQIKALKATNRSVILTQQTQNILRNLAERRPCLGLSAQLQVVKASLQKKIYYFQQLYTINTPLKKLSLEYWANCPHIIYLYLHSMSKRSDLMTSQVMAKIVTEKDEKERGWLLGEVELNNCKYDPIKNCLQVNDKNEVRKIPKVALVLGERQASLMQVMALPLFFQGKERFKLQIGSKLRDDGSVPKDKVFGILKTPQ